MGELIGALLELVGAVGEFFEWLRFWRLLLCVLIALGLLAWIYSRLEDGSLRTALTGVLVLTGFGAGVLWEWVARLNKRPDAVGADELNSSLERSRKTRPPRKPS